MAQRDHGVDLKTSLCCDCREASYLGLLNLERRRYTAFSDGGSFSLFILAFFLPVRKGIDDEWHPVLLFSLLLPLALLSLPYTHTHTHQIPITFPSIVFFRHGVVVQQCICIALSRKSVEIMEVQQYFSVSIQYVRVHAQAWMHAQEQWVCGFRTVCPL